MGRWRSFHCAVVPIFLSDPARDSSGRIPRLIEPEPAPTGPQITPYECDKISVRARARIAICGVARTVRPNDSARSVLLNIADSGVVIRTKGLTIGTHRSRW